MKIRLLTHVRNTDGHGGASRITLFKKGAVLEVEPLTPRSKFAIAVSARAADEGQLIPLKDAEIVGPIGRPRRAMPRKQLYGTKYGT